MADISKITLPNGSEYNIKDAVARKGQAIYYATCSTAAGTAAKVATTTDGDFTLETGAIVMVKFTNASTYNGTSTLNVDSTGAKQIYYVNATAATRYMWYTGEVVTFVYDGTHFVINEGSVATTTYYGVTKLSSATDSTSEVLAATPKAVKTAYDLANAAAPQSTTYTKTEVDNLIGDAVDFGTVGSNQNPVYFNNGDPEPIAFTFGVDDDQNVQVAWDGDAPEIVIPTTSALAISSGGTGATTAAGARTNLGLGSAATYQVVSSVQDDSNLVTNGAVKRYIDNSVKYKVSLTGDNTIPADSDLNDTIWLKTGTYANPLNTNTSSISNIPPELTETFMLHVYNPLYDNSTADSVSGTYIYRVQELTTYRWEKRWARLCYTDNSGTWNYNSWAQIYPTTVATGDSNGQVKVAGTNVDVKGWNTAATYDVETTVANDSKLPTGAAVYNHTANRTFYGTCSTAAATSAKVVELEDGDGFELKPGVVVGVKFSATNTASNMTLNVNNTGAIGVSYIAGTRYTGATANITGSVSYVFYYMYDGTYWTFFNHSGNYANNSNTVPAAQCETAAATAAKAATCTNHTLTANTYLHFNIRYANTAKSALTMNVDSSGAKPIYINGAASSSSNYTLPAGTYIAFYNGTNWYFNTDGSIPSLKTSISDNELASGAAVKSYFTNVETINTDFGITAYKVGRIVMLSNMNSTAVTKSANETIWTLPANIRPITTYDFVESYGKHRIIIQNDGTIVTKEAISNSYVRFAVTYISAS